MDKEYYTHCSVGYGKIRYRGYKVTNGVKRRIHGRVEYQPTVYLETDDVESEFRSLCGKPLREKRFDSIPEARKYVKEYGDVKDIYGYAPSRFEYNFLADGFRDVLEIGISDLCIGIIDIETTADHGKIDADEVPESINLITYQNFGTKKLVTFGYRKSTVDNFVLCKDESDLLRKVIQYIVSDDPDILTGWNCKGFDFNYIINRAYKLIGDVETNKLSPFGEILKKTDNVLGKEFSSYEITGRSILDLLDVYKKYRLIKRESYKLENICVIELGVGKNKLPFEKFSDNYNGDDATWDLFCSYNQIDVVRVMQLEERLGLLSLCIGIAYRAKVNFDDVYGPVKLWECMILSTLLNENKFAQIRRNHTQSGGIVGAYVHDPKPGFYDWVVSIDAASLYPNIAVGLNMSPETLVGVDSMCSEMTFADGLSREDTEYAYAVNGSYYSREAQGIIPRIMQSLMDERKMYKTSMLQSKQKYIDTKETVYKGQSDLYSVMEKATKVLANAGYGGISNSGFLFFDNRIAEGITMTGRYIIQYVVNHCNKRFNEFFKTDNHNYVLYMDTDSGFFCLSNIVQKYYSDKSPQQIVDALDKLVEGHLRKFIDEATDTISKNQNYFKNTIFFKREKICESAFFIAPKKYALKVWDNEGVRYKEPDYAITGIEVVRSSTPEVVRKALKECVIYITNRDIDSLRRVVADTHSMFMSIEIEKIAFPRSANNLGKYSDDTTIYTGGTPIAVRASLLHNHLLDKFSLGDKYQPISEGDKIRFIYLKEPNTLRENIIAFVDELPPEFGLHKYVDRELQFSKSFMGPIDNIMTAVGWTLDEKANLDDCWE